LKTALKNHSDATMNPINMEIPIVHLVKFLDSYAEEYDVQFGAGILSAGQCLADDYVLGKVYLSMVQNALRLLDGELGRLDGGILDITIRRFAKIAGFTNEEIEG
jgi:hypothetical protein